MGFTTRLFILYQEEVSLLEQNWMDPDLSDGPSQLTWTGYEIIDLGAVTRLEKLVNLQPNITDIRFGPHERAGICITACLLSNLFPKLHEDPHAVIAPPVLLDPYSKQETKKRTDGDHRRPVIDASRKMVREHEREMYHEERTLLPEKLAEHNLIQSLSASEINDHLEKHHLILCRTPFLWESCATLARWLHQAEAAKTEEWLQLINHPRALAIVRGWRAYLEEVGIVDARALFLFS